jgi:hypothetical protein
LGFRDRTGAVLLDRVTRISRTVDVILFELLRLAAIELLWRGINRFSAAREREKNESGGAAT